MGALNVCGDWYDLVDLPGGGRTAVAVGDVVGHGLRAAGLTDDTALIVLRL